METCMLLFAHLVIPRVLILVLLLSAHFQGIDLALWYGAQVMMRLHIACHPLRGVITQIRTADLIAACDFIPFLCTDKIIPAKPFTEIFPRTFSQDIVDVYGCRRGCNHGLAVVFYFFYVSGIVPTPLAGTGPDDVYQVPCAFSAYRSSSFHGSFGRYEIKFGEFSNLERACTGGIGLTEPAAVVCPVNAKLPKSRVDDAADTTGRDDEISAAGQYARPYAGVGFIGETGSLRVNDIICL